MIDPATVTQQAVLNSASIAACIITTSVCTHAQLACEGQRRYIHTDAATWFALLQALITEIKEDEPDLVGGVDDGMGGMTGMM